jgi:RNA polymerase sigma-70 factor (ECF subfamily)
VEPFQVEQLVLRCQRTLPDDPRPFEQLVTQYKGMVFATAYRLMGDRHEAEDQAQEVFLKVYRGIKALDQPATFSGWISRITVNTCLDALAKQKRRPATIQLAPMADEGEEAPQYADFQTPTPEQTAVRHELRHCLERTLAELDITGRAVITLRDIEDRPYQELAEMLGLGLSAVKMRIHRARLAFQQLLARICPDAWQAEVQV